ncbi:GyrI-like domain-containing protein [Knoellia sp. p5-6-4]|uniref:GyrI-like domain-containing protein n=1 Tax=unclassified Knoellia TaxID=2618719 RepID=UPI0023DCBE32|nr:GyrI-like domain-containing protein [Knoellia sp. p5-6-4]MDF2143470.1 GyrI-like domain-containing protein [Knoellia sp. p5-6-4]
MDEQVHVTTLPSQHVLVVRREVTLASIATGMDSAFGALWQHLSDSGVQPSGPPFVLYLGAPDGEFPIEVCVPVGTGPVGAQDIEARELPEGEGATLVHRGPYDGLAASWQTLTQWVGDSGRRPSGPPREVYVTDPRSCPPEDLRTELVIPLT